MSTEQDVRVAVRTVDDRDIIEIKGNHVIVSKVLSRVEALLSSKDTIDEVRFVAGNVLSIDANLESKLWRGRNIVVLTNKIKVSNSVCWNLSGKDSDRSYSGNAGTGTDGYGKQGSDGFAGESGGSVLILAKQIEQPDNLTIISHGGKGGKGQDGGNGSAGEDGKGISKSDLVDLFPPPCTILLPYFKLDKICRNLRRLARSYSTEWKETRHTFSNDISTSDVLENEYSLHTNLFLELVTHDGHEVTFSYEHGGGTKNCQSFFVYKGTPGTRGKPGGEYGLGGQGGFPGEIVVENLESTQKFNVKYYNNHGNDGEIGKGGLHGRNGKNGWDMGYMDYTSPTTTWPKYYGEDKNSKLTVEYYSRNSEDRVCCPYKERRSDYFYAEIEESRLEHQSQRAYDERNNSRSNNKRQSHSNAIRKKAISKRAILNAYSEYMSNIEKEQQLKQKRETEKKRKEAEAQKMEAEKQQREAEMQKREAEKQQREAEMQKREAEKQQMEAEMKKSEAEKQQREAEMQKREAEEQQREEETQKREAEKQQREAEIVKKQQSVVQKPIVIEKVKQNRNTAVNEGSKSTASKLSSDDTAKLQEISQQSGLSGTTNDGQSIVHKELKRQSNEERTSQHGEQRDEVEVAVEFMECDALQNGEETHHDELEKISDLHIRRYVNFSQDTNYQHQHSFVKVKTIETNTDRNSKQFSHLKDENVNIADWLKLKTLPLDHHELSNLHKSFASVKRYFANQKSSDDKSKQDTESVENMFLIKYKFVALQKIEQLLPLPCVKEDSGSELTAKSASRYLVECKEKNNSISHSILGSLNQYLYENGPDQRNKIVRYIKENVKSSDALFKRVIETFIIENDAPGGVDRCSKKYYDEFTKFSTKQRKNVSEVNALIGKELKKPQHKEILQVWDKNIDDDSYEDELVEMIQQDDTLNSLYKRLIELESDLYDWEKCYADVNVQTEFFSHIQKLGISSKSCRVLLAHVFNVNMRMYYVDEDGEIVLLEDHNSSSTTAIHVLCRADEFIQLKVDDKYLRLERARQHKDSVCVRVLKEIEVLKNAREIDGYLNRNIFAAGCFYEALAPTCDEKAAIQKIAEYFPENERQQIKLRLGNIASEYIGQEGILQYMLMRFDNEGRHVSYDEICYFINSALKFCIEDRQERYIFTWIIASTIQSNWIVEVVLLQMENDFKSQLERKTKWREYMTKIASKAVLLTFAAQHGACLCTPQLIDDILRLLSSVPIDTVSLSGLELSEWPYVLKEEYWKFILMSLVEWPESDSLSLASYYVLSIENTFGNDLVEGLLAALQGKRKSVSFESLVQILGEFHSQKWVLCEEDLAILHRLSITQWRSKMQEKYKANLQDLNASQLADLIQGNANTSANVKNQLPAIESTIKTLSDKGYMINKACVASFTEEDVKKWVKDLRNVPDHKKRQQFMAIRQEMLAVIDRAVYLKRGFRLRDTQRLTVLALLANDRSTLAQVSTGEGKSLIVVTTSIMKCLLGEKVDVVTSSSVLAKRDADVNKDMYGLFGITVSHNCSEDVEDRREAYSLHQVVYGDLASFQRDYLLDRFYGKNILGDREFANVIVDEVDSMLLDKGNNMLYLSHDIAGMDKLESVYIFIWQLINTPTVLDEEAYIETIHAAVLMDMFGVVKKCDIRKLDSKMDERNAALLWNRFVEEGMLDNEGKVLIEAIDRTKVEKILSPDFSHYSERLCFLLRECIARERQINVPNYLRVFVARHLKSWIKSAINALHMVPGQYYIVDVDRTGTTTDVNANIIILDRDTGTDQASSQWDEALHQFLQLKHGCKLSMQSLKAVFISNVTYFKKYELLYGLTGTLGSRRERKLLEEIHEVDFVTIPPAKSKQFEAYEPIICSKRDTWIETIRSEVDKLINIKKRSVLLICETVNDVETLHTAFGRKGIHKYVRDYEEFDIAQGSKKLEQGEIIIATNLAGRGTDIQISDGLKNAGGLHVCLTYLPVNIRIEDQAFGRAARSGDKGSGQMIILIEDGKNVRGLSKIFDLKKNRDVDELFRISAIKAYYETTIKTEESCFEAFQEEYTKKRKALGDARVPEAVKEILLQSCLDRWSFWLDENNSLIDKATDESRRRSINELLKQMLSSVVALGTGENEDATSNVLDSSCWTAWVEENPMQMVKLAKYLTQNKVKLSNETAAILFDEVIKREPRHCGGAYYYRAFALSKKIDWERNPRQYVDEQTLKELKKDLRAAARLFEEHSKFELRAAGVADKFKANYARIEGYVEQKQSMANLYSLFIRSIQDFIGHTVEPECFKNHDIKQELAGCIFKDLTKMGVLKRAKIKSNISEVQLLPIHTDYGVSVKRLRGFVTKNAGTFDEQQLQTSIRNTIHLPCTSEFWEALVQQNVLTDVVHYVVIDNKKLAAIDPSMMEFINQMIEDKKLAKQYIEQEEVRCILIQEPATAPDENVVVLRKDSFINCIGQQKYTLLAERGAFSFNAKAYINNDSISSCVFPSFDSLSVEDITDRARISEDEATKILSQLVEQNILETKTDKLYRLCSKLEDKDQLVPSYPVYESTVKSILEGCFSYRIALNNISRQLEEGTKKIHVEIRDSYRMFFMSLVEQDIIRLPKVKINSTETALEEFYPKALSLVQWKEILIRNLLVSNESVKKLLKHLFEHRLIIPDVPTELLSCVGHIIRTPFADNFTTLLSEAGIANYGINIERARSNKQAVNIVIANDESTLCYDISKSLMKCFENRMVLTDERTRKHILSVLSKLQASQKALKVPKFELKSITEFYGKGNFGNIEEMRVFVLNGLEYLIQVEEKKWTVEMLTNASIVLALGVAQIVIGAVIEVYSVGWMTHVGGAFIGEGVNDIMFAIGAFSSGHFSWQDYRQQKLQSLMITVGSAGVGMYLSRGAKVSRIGRKLANPGLEYGGKKVSESAGGQLMKAVGKKAVFRETVKRCALKTAQGVAIGISNTAVDSLVQHHLQGMLNSVGSEILSQMSKDVANHRVSMQLKQAYDLLGEDDARSLINDLTNSILNEGNVTDKFLPFTKQMAGSVAQGIASAVQKTGSSDQTLNVISKISTALEWVERAAQLNKMRGISFELLDNISREIEKKLKAVESTSERNTATASQREETKDSYEKFQKDIVAQWQEMLSRYVGQILAQHFVTPALKLAVNSTVAYVGKQLKGVLRDLKESELQCKANRLKSEHDKHLSEQPDMSTETRQQLTNQYHKQLLKIMYKTRNPTMLSNILREGVPMDLTCVNACTPLLHNLLRQRGVDITGLIITVHGDSGIKQSFCSGSGGPELHLNLGDGHFTFCGSDSENSVPGNNCLYGALLEAFPELGSIGAHGFRNLVCDSIQRNEEVRYHIRQGWHRLPMERHGAVGGARKAPNKSENSRHNNTESIQTAPNRSQRKIIRVEQVEDESSTTNDFMKMKDNKTTANASGTTESQIREPDYHLNARFRHTVRLAGELQNISELTGVAVTDLVKAGRSLYKAARESAGSDFHQAHVVRFTLNPELIKDHPELYDLLTKHAGHTQLVDKFVNVFHKIGGDIDKNQADWVINLTRIKFSQGLTDANRDVLKTFKDRFLDMHDRHIANEKKYTPEQSIILRNAKERISRTAYDEMFAIGHRGYTGYYKYPSATKPKPTKTKGLRTKFGETKNEE